MALNGGLGLIHYNMPEREQLSEVSRVKNHVHGLIQEPIRATPGPVDRGRAGPDREEAVCLQHVPGGGQPGQAAGPAARPRGQTPLCQAQSGRGPDPAPASSHAQQEGTGPGPHRHGGPVLHRTPGDTQAAGGGRPGPLVGPVHDERHRANHPGAQRAVQTGARQLISGSCAGRPSRPRAMPLANWTRQPILAHVGALVERGLDVVAVSTAHGHSRGVGETVRMLREAFPKLPIIAGNVTSAAGVEFLASCGANAIKVGQGPAPFAPRASSPASAFPSLPPSTWPPGRPARCASASLPTAASPSPATSSRH